jgi:hypothetical protein
MVQTNYIPVTATKYFLQKSINKMDPFHMEHHTLAPRTPNTWQLLHSWHHYIIIIIIILLPLVYYNWIIWMLVINYKTSYI